MSAIGIGVIAYKCSSKINLTGWIKVNVPINPSPSPVIGRKNIIYSKPVQKKYITLYFVQRKIFVFLNDKIM